MTPADHAARRWGGTVHRLISHRENAVYEMRLPDGSKAALRHHRPGYQSLASIADELAWTAGLADQGFPCPRPLTTDSDDLLATEDGQVFSAVTWLDGTPLAAQNLHDAQRQSTFAALGRLLSDLHRLTQGMGNIGAARPSWDLDGLTGPDPLWGRFWDTPPTNDPRRQKLAAARDTARDWLKGLKSPVQCLIHADALAENILGTPESLWLIDFDDCGHGYALYDLGVALTQHWDQPYLPDIAAALVDGYGANVSPDDLYKFMTLRCLASAGWVQGRMAADDPRTQTYVDRAVACAERHFGV